jgi:hypothetical protein
MVAGRGITRCTSARHSSAKPPVLVSAITRSPGLKCGASAPTALTTPAISAPGVKGSGGLTW